jgi:hypothetical protein
MIEQIKQHLNNCIGALPGTTCKGIGMDDQSTAVILTASKNTTYAGAGTVVYGGIFTNENAIAFGMVIGVLGLLINWFYQSKNYSLQKRETEARIRMLEEQASEAEDK